MNITKVKAIDPEDCQCPHCAIGEHLPLNSPYVQDFFTMVMVGMVNPPDNNLKDRTIVLYRDYTGRVRTVLNPVMVGGSDYIVVSAGAYDPPTDDEPNPLSINVSKIQDEHEDMQEHLINSVIGGAPYVNPSFSAFVAFRSPYGETGLIELPNMSSREVMVIPYQD